MDDRQISIVIPVFNEEDSLGPLAAEIRQSAERNGLRVRVVFVDDGSQDGSWERICSLAAGNEAIGGIRFRQNRGKAAALMAGFAAALPSHRLETGATVPSGAPVRGDLVFMMDADGQDPPEEIPRFIQKIDEGFDLVSGWKRHRLDPWHKVYPSRIFNRLISRLTGVHLHDHVCGFKCMKPEVVQDLRIYGELHRFIGVLSAAEGFRVTEIATLHRPRTQGVGKYGFSRFAKGFLDLIAVWFRTRYQWRPQHLIGVAGLVMLIAGVILGVLGRWIPLAWLVMMLGPGLVLIAIGLVAELIVGERRLDKLYTVTETVGWCAQSRPPRGSSADEPLGFEVFEPVEVPVENAARRLAHDD